MMPKLKIIGKTDWRKEPITQKQIDHINRVEEELDIPRSETLALIGYPPSSDLENLTKGEASELITMLDAYY